MHNGNNWMGGGMAARHTEAAAGCDTDANPVRPGSPPACFERGPAPVKGRDRTVPAPGGARGAEPPPRLEQGTGWGPAKIINTPDEETSDLFSL